MSEAGFPYPGLPKWPQMRVSGHSVTPEQASEIIRRTDTFFTNGYGGNDDAWNHRVKTLVEMPLGSDAPGYYDESATRDWQADWEAERAWKEAWGCLETEYVHNSWISCSFVGGPHGWCSPAGTIYFRDNVGKWPSCEDIEADWRKIAEAFPFLDAEVVLMTGESCDDHIAACCGFIVRDGAVAPKLPGDHAFHQGDYAWANVGPSLEQQVMAIALTPARYREAGIPESVIRQWSEGRKIAA